MQDVAEDVFPYIGAAATNSLQTVRGITGLPAREAAANIRSVEIDWNAAHSNFVSVLNSTRVRQFDIFRTLISYPQIAFGALVSFVYQ